MSTFVIGDIHGRAKALEEVLSKCGFDPYADRLICLGDIVDGGFHSRECVEILTGIPDLVVIRGNHDQWFMGWLNAGAELPAWVHSGGKATMYSYDYRWRDIPEKHRALFNNSIFYHVDTMNNCFVHGGFNPDYPLSQQNPDEIMWSRELIPYSLKNGGIPYFNMVFSGHTSTMSLNKNLMTPQFLSNLVLMDTGGGWEGKLSIMDIGTLEYWQSRKQDKALKF